MENLTFNSNISLDTSNLVRIGDLSNFEGPLLSLFEELNSGHLYLFDWVDRNEKFNRWLIYRVLPSFLLHYINCRISHSELFENRPLNEVYFTDIDVGNKPFYIYDSFLIESLPKNYFPNSDNFFDLSDCNNFKKIKSVIINSLSKQKTDNEYSIVHRIDVLKRVDVKLAYFNQAINKISSIAYRVNYKEYTYIPIVGNLSLNNIKGLSFKLSSTEKNYETRKKKSYANRYN
jgi:hypothetical protein